jgi:NADH-ubiquinone oxidoreductase chain 4
MYMFNRIALGGKYTKYFTFFLVDLNKREFSILFILSILTILFGIYSSPILDTLSFNVSQLIYKNTCS